MLNRFVKWCSIPARCKSPEAAAAHHVRLLKIWDKMGSGNTTLSDITRANLETAVTEMMKDTNRSTLRTYILRFQWLLKFLKMEEFFENPDRPSYLDDSHLNLLDLDAKSYMKLCAGKAKDLINQKHLDDYHEILDPRTVLDMLDSKYIDVVTVIINNGKLFERPSNYTRVRNHLMALLVACNGQHASAIREMHHKAVMRASVGPKQWRTISVAKHKTSRVYGPANFSLKPEFYFGTEAFRTSGLGGKKGG